MTDKKYGLECYMTLIPKPIALWEKTPLGKKPIASFLLDRPISYEEAKELVNKINNYNDLLEFVRNIAAMYREENEIYALADAGYRVEDVINARRLLKRLDEE